MTNNEVLRIISNETKASIDQMDVVTPSIFASIFFKYADEHNAAIEDEKDLSADLLQFECSNLTKLQTATSKNAQQLAEHTNKAIHAIKTKNEASLAEVLQETTTLRKEIEKLKETVYTDELTHSYNRKWLHDNFLEDGTANFKDKGVLALIDLNYFKQVNDTYGHIIGDKVLVFIANKLKLSRSKVVRYGGDEFIIIFEHNTSVDLAKQILHEIREDVISKKLQTHDSQFRVSFSYGLAAFKQNDSLAQTIENADKNMYADKIAIKKRVTGI